MGKRVNVRHIIVDGYNVIRADEHLYAIERQSLERAREVLAQTLGSSPRLARDHVVVVFDGRKGLRTTVHSQRLGRVTLLYSAMGQTADDVIVQQAERLAPHGEVIVVTNDIEVRENCRAAGCTVTGSENLLAQMPGRQLPRRAARIEPEEDEFETRGLSTDKRGNPRRASRRARRRRDVRF